MKFPKNNRIFIALFFCGIIIPTSILAVLSFRNVQNEQFLAEKNFEDSRNSFAKQAALAVQNEQIEILKEAKNASQFLYEQPQSLLEFDKAVSFKSVPGIEAIFLFNERRLIYPSVPIRENPQGQGFSSVVPGYLERGILRAELSGTQPEEVTSTRLALLLRENRLSPEDRALNWLGLLRDRIRERDFDEALRIIDALERTPNVRGYLQDNLGLSLALAKFEVFVEEHRHTQAENYCLSLVSNFLLGRSPWSVSAAKFFFDEALSRILSFEELSQKKRDAFWNLRENLNRQLEHAQIFFEHREFLQRFSGDPAISKDGVLYKRNRGRLFFHMAYPWLSGDQAVVGMVDDSAYAGRILQKLSGISREWKGVPFTVADLGDSILLGKVPEESDVISRQVELGAGLGWTLTLYDRDSEEITAEARHKIFLLSGLVAFSLLTVLLGLCFILRTISQERKLITMKTNFLSSISHELKTPLTSIKMFAEMISNGRVQNIEKCQEYSKLISKESTRLENLVAAILNYTRMETGKQTFHWQKLDLSECVGKVFEAVLDIADNRGISMTRELSPGAFVIGDYTALYSLAQSLMENAIKYTNPPGKVLVRVAVEGEKVVFSVKDSGIGIASSEQKNIFNDFYRVGDEMTRSTKGSGLGLAIVKRVAEAHKAGVSVQSHPGKGSTFTVRLKKAE